MQVVKPSFRLRSAYDVAYSPDGAWLVTAGKNSALTLWHVEQRKAVAKVTPLKHPSFVDFSPGGVFVVVKNTGGAIAVCPVPLGTQPGRIYSEGPDEGCRACFSADGSFLIDGSWSGRIVMRRVADFQEMQVEQFPHCMVVDASCSADRSLWAFAVRASHGHSAFGGAADFVTVRRWPPVGQPPQYQLGPWRRVERAQLNPNGNRLAVVKDNGLTVIDLDAPERPTTVPIKSPVGCRALAWSPDGRLLVTNQEPGYTIHRTNDLTAVARIDEKYPAAAAFSPDGQWLALGSWEQGTVIPLEQLL